MLVERSAEREGGSTFTPDFVRKAFVRTATRSKSVLRPRTRKRRVGVGGAGTGARVQNQNLNRLSIDLEAVQHHPESVTEEGQHLNLADGACMLQQYAMREAQSFTSNAVVLRETCWKGQIGGGKSASTKLPLNRTVTR